MGKADLHDQCNPGIPDNDFKTVCEICRNVDCSRAGGVASPWTQRMQEQAEALLRNPKFGNPGDPKYAKLADIPTVEPQPEWPKPQHRVKNTEVPRGGIMVGGGPPPARKQPAHDPWAVPKKSKDVVEVGATVRMGKKES